MADSDGVLFDGDSAQRIAETVEIVLGAPDEGGGYQGGGGAPADGVELWVECSSTTTTAGRYPGNWFLRDTNARTWAAGGASGGTWVVGADGETLTVGTRYRAVASGPVAADGKLELVAIVPATGGGGGGGGGIAIGDPVGGGTDTYVLFVGGGGLLSQSAKFAWNDSPAQLTLTDGTRVVRLPDQIGGSAASFDDGLGHSVQLCGLSGAVYSPDGDIRAFGAAGKTFCWVTAVPAPTPTGGFYGGSGNTCGEPDAWVLINAGGTMVKVPAYLP